MDIVGHKTDNQLDKLQRQTFNFFWNEANPSNGLVADRTAPDWPASVASTGFALTSLPIAVERGFITREMAAERTLSTLRFFLNSKHGPEPEAAGYRGFYYRFIDMHKGRRARMSEISILDSSVLFAGALVAASYFDNGNETESEIRYLADRLYRKADWQWTLNNGKTILHRWKPETGFIKCGWKGYDEGMLPYILGLGSPESPLPAESYTEWTSSYEWKSFYGYDYLYAPPLLIHQLPQVWIDFRNIRDEHMRNRDSDYFMNSVKATMIQYRYALENPMKFEGYSQYFWGITLSDGPGPSVLNIKGSQREFFGYLRRGVPLGPDDGTVSPWAAIASIAFTPEIVLPAIDHMLHEPDLNILNSYGFRSAFNPTFPHKPHNPHGWRAPCHYGTNQGPAMAMIENYRTGLLWDLCRKNQYIVSGLLKAGFRGGWLEGKQALQPGLQVNHAHV